MVEELNEFLHPYMARRSPTTIWLHSSSTPASWRTGTKPVITNTGSDGSATEMALSWQGEDLDHPPGSVGDLRHISCPTLLVKGTVTAHWLKRVVEVLGQHLPDVTVLELEGDHACHIQTSIYSSMRSSITWARKPPRVEQRSRNVRAGEMPRTRQRTAGGVPSFALRRDHSGRS